MRKKSAITKGTIILIGVILVMFLASGFFPRLTGKKDGPEIDPELVSRAKVSEDLDYLIYFEDKADLSGAEELPWEERGWFVYNALTAQADRSQAGVRAFLDRRGVSYQSFWIQNVIAVEASSSTTLYGLTRFVEIQSLQSVPQVFIEDPLEKQVEKSAEIQTATDNLLHIRADQAWALGFRGEDFVVGSIDSGVRYTHEALADPYRGNLGNGAFDHNYSWWDAVGGKDAAYDDHGHGSHTTGIMVGTEGDQTRIGIAPEASWIACKAISGSGFGYGWDFLECGQFMLAPWDLEGQHSNPSLRPHVVNNSWGSCATTYSDWYEDTIDAWLAAGIYPVFSNGNAGNCSLSSPPGLNTVGNPARSYHVTAVGSTGKANGLYADHSNWGPTDSEDVLNPAGYPWIKPQVVAPGLGIRSAVASADDAYAYWGGTSMAAPHVAGLVALMWGAGDCLVGDYVTTESLMQDSAVPIPYDTGNGDEGPGNVPNHATGWGEIDALAAVSAARDYCHQGRVPVSIMGRVIDGSGHSYPLYAKISLVSASHQVQIFTNPFDGTYSATVYEGMVYDLVIASLIDGYYAVAETGLVFDGDTVWREDALKVRQECLAPGYVLSGGVCEKIPGGVVAGFVTDIGSEMPLTGVTVSSAGSHTYTIATPNDRTLRDGFYWLFLPMCSKCEGVELLAERRFYLRESAEVVLSPGEVIRQDFRIESCWHKLAMILQQTVDWLLGLIRR